MEVTLNNLGEVTQKVEEWLTQAGENWKASAIDCEDGTVELNLNWMTDSGTSLFLYQFKFKVGATITLMQRRRHPYFWLTISKQDLIYVM